MSDQTVSSMIVTFGYGQKHPLTGLLLDDCYTRVPVGTHAEARAQMAASVFGRQYAFIYDMEEGPRGAGILQHRLHEVSWVPPSPVGLALVEPLGQISPNVWVDRVVQPAEIAHHLAVRALLADVDAAQVVRAVLTPDAPELPAQDAEVSA